MNTHLKGYKKIPQPKGHFYADPFIIKHKGLNYIFFEDYSYKSEKGVISCISIDIMGKLSDSTVVLEQKYHLSYSFIFQWKNEIYMMPETAENHTIEIYKATDFPMHWALEKVIMKDLIAVDSTIFQAKNLFWLFTCISEDGSFPNKHLYAFYANSPFEKWRPHPLNPIVSDISCGRPAGNLFFKNKKLLRPGQDCTNFYGQAININEIKELNTKKYTEIPVCKLNPSIFKGDFGAHTYNFNIDYEITDRKRMVCKLLYKHN